MRIITENIAFLLIAVPASAAPTTSLYTGLSGGNNLGGWQPGDPCPDGGCFKYSTTDEGTGSFTVSAPLAANLSNTDISTAVTNFSFSDSHNTYSNSDPKVRINVFSVTTDSSGALTSWRIGLQRYPNLASIGQRVDTFFIAPFPPIGDFFENNDLCTAQGATPGTAASPADTCSIRSFDAETSQYTGKRYWFLHCRASRGRSSNAWDNCSVLANCSVRGRCACSPKVRRQTDLRKRVRPRKPLEGSCLMG